MVWLHWFNHAVEGSDCTHAIPLQSRLTALVWSLRGVDWLQLHNCSTEESDYSHPTTLRRGMAERVPWLCAVKWLHGCNHSVQGVITLGQSLQGGDGLRLGNYSMSCHSAEGSDCTHAAPPWRAMTIIVQPLHEGNDYMCRTTPQREWTELK